MPMTLWIAIAEATAGANFEANAGASFEAIAEASVEARAGACGWMAQAPEIWAVQSNFAQPTGYLQSLRWRASASSYCDHLHE